MGNKIKPLWNIMGFLPHASAQGDDLGTEGDRRAGNALTDGSSSAGSECTGQSCMLVTAPSAVPDKARGWTRSEVPPGGPTRSRMRQGGRWGWRPNCSLDLWSIQETRLEISCLQYRSSVQSGNRAGERLEG